MILNSYAVLMVFVAALRLLLAVLVLALAVSAWRGRGKLVTADGRSTFEDRSYLVFLLALVLLVLNLASWPLLYLLLQSYVKEWPDVMCIYGVTQIGKNSMNSSRYLPDLLRFLQFSKPALVFVGGGWFVLYLLNRRTHTGPLLGRLFLMLLPLGGLAAADAAAELSYVGIPKKEEFPESGCCTAAADDGARFLPPILLGESGRSWLYSGYYAGNLALILAILVAVALAGTRPGLFVLGGLFVGGLVVLAMSGVFLTEIAAPALLKLPYHHCAYDLIPRFPEALAAIAFFAAGLFFLGWAGLARWLAASPETAPFLGGTVRTLLRLSAFSYLASLAMLSLELAVA